MVKALPDILATIVEQKKLDLEVREPDIEERAERSIAQRRDFLIALKARPPAIIAEIKKASPSKGVLAAQFDPPAVAHLYEQGGAAALSVLTDEKHFQGRLSDLESARAAVRLPVLRKDFTIDPYHVQEAAAHGADAILLIAAILSEQHMRDFRELAERYGMAALVEVHDEEELAPAIASGARIIGVNNRNLHTFEVALDTWRHWLRIANTHVETAMSAHAVLLTAHADNDDPTKGVALEDEFTSSMQAVSASAFSLDVRQHRAGDPVRPRAIGRVRAHQLIRRKGLGDSVVHVAGVVDEHIKTPGPLDDAANRSVHRRVFEYVQLERAYLTVDPVAERAGPLGVRPVGVPHRRVYGVAPRGERPGGEGAHTCSGASNEHGRGAHLCGGTARFRTRRCCHPKHLHR